MSDASDVSAPDLPFHLRGNFAPVLEERTALDLPVEGSVPRELAGRYLRNGPNPRSGESPHWFLGDGMLHGVELRGGRAVWYRNRWVRTKEFLGTGRAIASDGTRDLTAGLANTHIVYHAGRLFALVESSFPVEVTPLLETRGPYDFGGRLRTPMTAHPKIDPETGELLFFGYDFRPPFLTFHRADAAGRLTRSEPIEVAGPTMMHDFAVTRTHVVFLDLPIVFDGELALAGRFPYRWDPSYGARLGVMPREGTSADVRWIEIESCYVFHALNAYDDGSRVILDVVRYPELWTRESNDRFAPATLWRFALEPTAGAAKAEALDDRHVEFPRIDERRLGRRHRYGYAVRTAGGPDSRNTALLKYDLETGAVTSHEFGPGRHPSEAVFVPAFPEADEDQGFVLAFVYDRESDGSELAILAAADFAAPPVARVRLPQRVPFGFHGSWHPDPDGRVGAEAQEPSRG